MELDLDAFAAYLRDYNLSARTIRGYLSNVRLSFEDKDPLSRLRNAELAPKTRRRTLAAVRSYATWRGDSALLERLRRLGRQLPAARRVTPKTPMTRTQWKQICDLVAGVEEPAERAVIGIMAVRGLRCGDVLRMQPAQIKNALVTGTLTYQAKGERWLEFTAKPMVPYLRELRQQKSRWRNVWDLIVPKSQAENREHQAYKRVCETLTALGEEVGVPDIHPHKLRRTYAVLFYEACGHDLVALQEHMQWANLETAKGYVDHVRRHELDAIADAMRETGNDDEEEDDGDE